MKKIEILLIALTVIGVGFLSGCNEQVGRDAPIINSFIASPTVIVLGNTSVLNWSVKGATNISIDNQIGPVPFSGPYTIMPTQNTTYTLTATNSYGNSNKSVKVYVNKQSSEEGEDPIINSFTATPSVIILGNTSLLKWSVTGATSINIDNGIGNVALSGPYIITPTQNTTYTLTATNSYGNSNKSVTVYINKQSSEEGEYPIINSFTAAPNPVIFGNNTVLYWSVTGATNVSIDNGIGNVPSSGSYTFSPSLSRKYILTASNEYGITYASIILNVKKDT